MRDDIRVTPIILDLETCGLPNAADFLEPVSAAKNLKDPAKIQADIEQRTAERLEKLALDWNVGRIAALAWWTEETGITVRVCADELEEAEAIVEFWFECRQRTIVGFCLKQFDLRFLVQRSRYLGIPYPILDFSKYSRKGITDLYLDLTFGDGTYDQGAMRRTLKAFCKRFGIPCTDAIDGKDIPALVEKGEWEAVAAHVRADVEMTLALAVKLGVVRQEAAEAVAL
jgi:hypothetical protein